jgi:hypothetical protein
MNTSGFSVRSEPHQVSQKVMFAPQPSPPLAHA